MLSLLRTQIGLSSGMNNYIIVGTSRSGLSLLSAILNCSRQINVALNDESVSQSIEHLDNPSMFKESLFCLSSEETNVFLLPLSPQIYETHGIRLLDALNAIHFTSPKTKFIWLVRDPVVLACSCYTNLLIPPKDALDYWYNVNMCISYFAKSMGDLLKLVKFERLLICRRVIEQVFDFIGAEFNKQFLTYGDFDQTFYNDRTFQRGTIDPEKIDTYSKTQCGLTKADCAKLEATELVRNLGYVGSYKD